MPFNCFPGPWRCAPARLPHQVLALGPRQHRAQRQGIQGGARRKPPPPQVTGPAPCTPSLCSTVCSSTLQVYPAGAPQSSQLSCTTAMLPLLQGMRKPQSSPTCTSMRRSPCSTSSLRTTSTWSQRHACQKLPSSSTCPLMFSFQGQQLARCALWRDGCPSCTEAISSLSINMSGM